MLYSAQDLDLTRKQLIRRILFMVLLALLPNLAAVVILCTVRIKWLIFALGILGGALAIFQWGICCYPVVRYYSYLKELLSGRSHQFTATLTQVLEDSLHEGVECKTLMFRENTGTEEERLCYLDAIKYTAEDFRLNASYAVTVHGQSIIAFSPVLND